MLSERRTVAGRDPRTPHSWNYAVDPCRSPGALSLPLTDRRKASTLRPHGSIDLVEEARSMLSDRRKASGRKPRTPHYWTSPLDPMS